MTRPLAFIINVAFGIVAAAIFTTNGAHADKRVALVIGNGAYQKVPALPNPPNDASDVAAAFERLGFSVKKLTNATFDDMRRGLLDFGRNARGSDMAVIFFAGHGIEIGGENWLIPIDAELKTDTDAENEAISLRTVMLQVANAGNLGLVILDACRNNPFGAKIQRTTRTRAVDRGLARTEPTDNVLVAYAAKDGTTANDGSGRNSPFSAALLRNLETPGLEITFMFRNIRDDVMAATKREQQPFVYGSLSKEAIYLKAGPSVPTHIGEVNPPAAAPAPDEILWGAVKDSKVAAVFEEFLSRFPASPRATDARRRLQELKRTAVAAAQDPISAKPGSSPSPQTAVASRETSAHAAANVAGLFKEADMQRVKAIAAKLELVLPEFTINRPASTLPPTLRQYSGIWASKIGFGGGRGRQGMLIVTNVETDGKLMGYFVYGPPTPQTIEQTAAGYHQWLGTVAGDILTYPYPRGTTTVQFSGDNLFLTQKRDDGRTPTITLEPVWRLVDEEHSAKR